MKIRIEFEVTMEITAESYEANQWAYRSTKTIIQGIELDPVFMGRDLIDMRNGTFKYFGNDRKVYYCTGSENVTFEARVGLIEYLVFAIVGWWRSFKTKGRGLTEGIAE